MCSLKYGMEPSVDKTAQFTRCMYLKCYIIFSRLHEYRLTEYEGQKIIMLADNILFLSRFFFYLYFFFLATRLVLLLVIVFAHIQCCHCFCPFLPLHHFISLHPSLITDNILFLHLNPRRYDRVYSLPFSLASNHLKTHSLC